MSAKPIKAIRSEQSKIKAHRLLMKIKIQRRALRPEKPIKAIRSQQGNNVENLKL